MTDTDNPSYGVILFSPDATVTGKYDLGLDALAVAGVVVVLHRWIRVTRQQVAALYVNNRKASPTPADRIVDDLFALDYSLACVGWDPTATAETPFPDRLCQLKGPTHPTRCRPHHLRHLLGATTSLTNCVHTSDTPATTRREVALLLGLDPVELGTAADPRPLPPHDLSRRPTLSAVNALAHALNVLEAPHSGALDNHSPSVLDPWDRLLARAALHDMMAAETSSALASRTMPE